MKGKPTKPFLALLILALLTLLSVAAAERWSVQTVALRDLREAEVAAEDLRAHAFDAYTEFAMNRGLQFVRVRVGCFETREAAEAMASAMRVNVTATAEAVEFSEGAPVTGCVQVDVGFLKPTSWDVVSGPGEAPTFKVVVAGLEALVGYDGERWRMVQGGGPLPMAPVDPFTGRFQQIYIGGSGFLRQDDGSRRLIVCPGRMLTQAGPAVISEQGDALVACQLRPSGAR